MLATLMITLFLLGLLLVYTRREALGWTLVLASNVLATAGEIALQQWWALPVNGALALLFGIFCVKALRADKSAP